MAACTSSAFRGETLASTYTAAGVSSAYDRLASSQGLKLLALLAEYTEAQAPAAAAAARKVADEGLAAAALTTAFARRRAAASHKFTRASEMFFTRTGYEQSSSEAIARHCAGRFARFERVVDLCCGIGGDTIEIARALNPSGRVDGVDLDEDALACARHNAVVYGVAERVGFAHGDALRWPLAGAAAAFADPSRRGKSGRAVRGEDYQPPLAALMARCAEIRDAALGVKIAPGLRVTPDALGEQYGVPVELEHISERGVCKEAILWCGSLARFHGARRATVIAAQTHMVEGDPQIRADVRALDRWLGEPDPAVIRSGLLGVVCQGIAASLLDPDLAYVTASEPIATPFVRWYEVTAATRFAVKRLRELLRARDIGSLVIKTRAFPLRPEEIEALLKPRGSQNAVLVCTTIRGAKTAIVCRAPAQSVLR